MSNFSNITVIHHDNDKVELLIDGQKISDRYDIHLDQSVIEELQNLENGSVYKLFEQFIFSHTDLNFEHSYVYTNNIVKADDGYSLKKNFVYRITAADQAPLEHVITNQGEEMSVENVRAFIDKQVQMSLEKYTDLNYAY